jgi:hypothetical protein
VRDNAHNTRGRARLLLGATLFAAPFLAGCTHWSYGSVRYQPVGMWNDARLKPMEGTKDAQFGSTARRIPAGTIARGQLMSDDPVHTGRTGGKLTTRAPIAITPGVLARGQERFNVYCSPCHSRTGNGEGMIVQRGFPHPPDYAIARLRKAPIGHFYDVITNGYGIMYSYAPSIPTHDRWAIAAYIRVLQASRPDTPPDAYKSERERARQMGIPDPTRPMNVPAEGGHGAEGSHDAAPAEHGAEPRGAAPEGQHTNVLPIPAAPGAPNGTPGAPGGHAAPAPAGAPAATTPHGGSGH